MSAARTFTPSPLREEDWGEGRVLAMTSISPLPLAGEGWGRGAPACMSSQMTKRFRPPAGGRTTFSLRAQRESSQRERAPRLALAGPPARQVREAVPGFSSGLLPARKGIAIHGDARCATSSSPPHRRPGAPEKQRAPSAQKQQQQHPSPTLPCEQGRETTGARGLAFAPASGAQDARLLCRAPSAAVSRGRSGRAAGVAREGNAFSTGQESGRKARPRLTDFPSMDGRKASPRGVVFSWLLLFWTSKREVARPPAGGRNRFETSEHAEAKASLIATLSLGDREDRCP